VPAIVVDANIVGHVDILTQSLMSDTWREIWEALDVPILYLADLELPDDTPDDVLWRKCQEQQAILLTANRNHEDPSSLEATLRAENTPDSLPVLTLADPEAVRRSRSYANRVVERLLNILMEIDRYRGAGRLYLP
jgi:hypothetical protein